MPQVSIPYRIYLTDPVAYAARIAQYPTGVQMPPALAATTFNAPLGGQNPGSGLFGAPLFNDSVAAARLTPPGTYLFHGACDANFVPYLAIQTWSPGVYCGSSVPTAVVYFWIGYFFKAPTPIAPPPTDPPECPIPARRWLEGFETPGIAFSSALNCARFSTDASRHVGGRGLAIRGDLNAVITGTISRYDATLFDAVTQSWERFYLRLRKLPTTGTVIFYRTSYRLSALVGHALGITPAGQIAVFKRDAAGVNTLMTTVPGITLPEWTGLTTHDAWVKLDLLIQIGTAPAPSTLAIYVDGVLCCTVEAASASWHTSSLLGNIDAIANDLYLDVDDWFNAAWPLLTGVLSFTGKDWLNGTKIVLVRPHQFNASHDANWVGDFRVLEQNALGATPIELTCSTASTLCAVDTDTEAVIADEDAIGAASMLVVAYTKRGVGVDGELGYSIAGGAAVMATIAQTPGSLAAQGVMYPGPGTALMPMITPIVLQHTKGADAAAATIAMLHAQVELVGKWGLEDGATAGTGPHNTPYPRTPWATRSLAPPLGFYGVIGGTYVGNGTGQDLPAFPTPIHWLLIRPTTGSTGGYFWLSPSYSSHLGWQEGAAPQIVEVREDSVTGEFIARVAGAGTQINANGITYQYIAISDPGMRFMLNGTLVHKLTLAARTHNLINPAFTPGFAFIVGETQSTTTTRRLYGKGPGQAAASIVNYQPAVVAAALTFATGALLTDTALHGLVAGGVTTYSAWRNQDGHNDPNEASVVNYGSYTGNGTGARTINLLPASGKRPLFAIIFAESGTNGCHRDPSHTGTNSALHTGTDSANGITAGGIDSFTVASAFNANNVVYSYFVLFADATACNNGWGCNGEYYPIEPVPTNGVWPVGPNPGPVVPPPGPPTPPPTPPSPPVIDGEGCTAPILGSGT